MVALGCMREGFVRCVGVSFVYFVQVYALPSFSFHTTTFPHVHAFLARGGTGAGRGLPRPPAHITPQTPPHL